MSFLAELKRRNIIRVLIAYLAAAWFLIQIADTVVPAYALPDSVVGILITILAIGLIPVVIVSWVFEWTPKVSGVMRMLLAKIRELRVISRSTAFAYRGDVHIATVAEELDVAYVLEGSVRMAGNTVRITAQFIDARIDAHVWSETWDRELVDIFEIQDEVAQNVAD